MLIDLLEIRNSSRKLLEIPYDQKIIVRDCEKVSKMNSPGLLKYATLFEGQF